MQINNLKNTQNRLKMKLNLNAYNTYNQTLNPCGIRISLKIKD